MVNFEYMSPTRLIFGKGVVEKLTEVMAPLGRSLNLPWNEIYS